MAADATHPGEHIAAELEVLDVDAADVMAVMLKHGPEAVGNATLALLNGGGRDLERFHRLAAGQDDRPEGIWQILEMKDREAAG